MTTNMTLWDCSRVHCVFPMHTICLSDDADHIYAISKRITKTLSVSRNGLSPNLDESYFVVYRSKPRPLTQNDVRLYKKQCMFLQDSDPHCFYFLSIFPKDMPQKDRKQLISKHKEYVPLWELRCSDFPEERVLRIFYSGMVALFLANTYCGIYHGDAGSESSWLYSQKNNRLILTSFYNSQFSVDKKLFSSDIKSFCKLFVSFFSSSLSQKMRSTIRKDPVRFAINHVAPFQTYLSLSYVDPYEEQERKKRFDQAISKVLSTTTDKFYDGSLHLSATVDAIPYIGPYFKNKLSSEYGINTIGEFISFFASHQYDKRLIKKMLSNKNGKENVFAYRSVHKFLELHLEKEMSMSSDIYY